MAWWHRVIVVAILLVCSCANVEACEPLVQRIAKRVNIVRVVDVTHLSTSGMNLYIEVDNDTCHRLVVNEAEVDVVSKGEVIATISLRDRVVIRGKRTTTVLVPLRFKARSSFVLVRLLERMLDPNSELMLSYRLRGGTGLFKRTFVAENVAVAELFGSSTMSGEALREVVAIIR